MKTSPKQVVESLLRVPAKQLGEGTMDDLLRAANKLAEVEQIFSRINWTDEQIADEVIGEHLTSFEAQLDNARGRLLTLRTAVKKYGVKEGLLPRRLKENAGDDADKKALLAFVKEIRDAFVEHGDKDLNDIPASIVIQKADRLLKKRLKEDEDDEEVKELDASELAQKWCDLMGYYHFEMDSGVRKFEELVNVLGYRDIDEFLADNSGCINAMIEWIGEHTAGASEWEENLRSTVAELEFDAREQKKASGETGTARDE